MQPSEDERPLEELLEDVVEGLWAKLRDVILVNEKLERFVF